MYPTLDVHPLLLNHTLNIEKNNDVSQKEYRFQIHEQIIRPNTSVKVSSYVRNVEVNLPPQLDNLNQHDIMEFI